ncbi:MAG: response regulator, partial [Desulfobacteraceae bacterium]
ATKRLRADETWQDIPIIALTATIFKEDQEKMKQCGCSGFLPKPIDEAQLFAALRKYLPYHEKEPSPEKPGLPGGAKEFAQDLAGLKPEALAEIMSVLAGRLMKKWRQLEGSMFLDQWAAFGAEVKLLGEKFAVQTLVNYGQHLLDSASDLNIVELKKTIRIYPQLANTIDNQYK